uniref:Probable membrane transporter protein n=1 Tax=Desulfobacca acetoxidans TaxID=60893 RepID=A0A7V6A1J2_9BACT
MAPHETTLVYLGLIALGFVVGTYGTLIGAGGGFVLMPLLLLLYPHEDANRLTAISLAVVFFNALSGSGAYAKMKRIDFKSGLMFAAATIPGAIFGVFSTSYVSRLAFDVIFGAVMIVAGLFMVFKPKSDEEAHVSPHKRSAHEVTRILMGADGISYEYSFNPILGIVLSVFVGFVSSFLGIGGGIVHVPAMAYLLHFPVHIATATSHFVLAIMTFTGTLVHIWTGSFHHGAHRAAALAIGVLPGAQLGAYLSNKIKGSWIIRGLALALVLVGIRILIAAFW